MTHHDDLAAYRRRLGVAPEPPSAEALAQLHRAHVERIPYETFWIHLGQPWGIDTAESVRRFAREARGGYCFQLNGAFAALLTDLGYHVTRHVAGVHGTAGPDPATMGNHVALVVNDLPSDTNPDGRWYVDTGLGDALYEPLPLITGVHAHGPSRFGLTRVADGVGDWHLTHDLAGSVSGVSIAEGPVTIGEFAARHTHNATSPESGFARTVTAQRRHALGTSVLRGCVYSATTVADVTKVEIERRSEWIDLLADEFGIHLDCTPDALDTLWANVRRSHEAWSTTLLSA